MSCLHGDHLTQSLYVPLQVNRFAENILLIVQYRYWFPTDRNLSHWNDLYWLCTSFEKAFSGACLQIFYVVYRGGRDCPRLKMSPLTPLQTGYSAYLRKIDANTLLAIMGRCTLIGMCFAKILFTSLKSTSQVGNDSLSKFSNDSWSLSHVS